MEDNHELIVVLANVGFADVVMNAAREEGARGGTILHARGAGNSTITSKYGLAITPEKEMFFIVTKPETKDSIMHAINKAAGLETPAHGIIFTMPVSSVCGLKFE